MKKNFVIGLLSGVLVDKNITFYGVGGLFHVAFILFVMFIVVFAIAQIEDVLNAYRVKQRRAQAMSDRLNRIVKGER